MWRIYRAETTHQPTLKSGRKDPGRNVSRPKPIKQFDRPHNARLQFMKNKLSAHFQVGWMTVVIIDTKTHDRKENHSHVLQ